MSGSNTPRIRIPEDLVLLELEADGEARFEDPRGEVGGVDLAESDREQNRAAVGQAMLTDHVHSPVEIGTVTEDELELVGGPEPFDVAPDVGFHLARAGRLEVEDDADAGIDRSEERRVGKECR